MMHKKLPSDFIHTSIKALIFTLTLIHVPHVYAKKIDSISIVTASQNFSALSSGKAKMLFKGKVKRLNGNKYSLIDWPGGSKMKKVFYQSLMGQSEVKINATRAKLIFSGQGFPPKEMQDNQLSTLDTLLKTTPNSIGYAPTSELSDEFFTLFIIEVENDDEK